MRVRRPNSQVDRADISYCSDGIPIVNLSVRLQAAILFWSVWMVFSVRRRGHIKSYPIKKKKKNDALTLVGLSLFSLRRSLYETIFMRIPRVMLANKTFLFDGSLCINNLTSKTFHKSYPYATVVWKKYQI